MNKQKPLQEVPKSLMIEIFPQSKTISSLTQWFFLSHLKEYTFEPSKKLSHLCFCLKLNGPNNLKSEGFKNCSYVLGHKEKRLSSYLEAKVSCPICSSPQFWDPWQPCPQICLLWILYLLLPCSTILPLLLCPLCSWTRSRVLHLLTRHGTILGVK